MPGNITPFLSQAAAVIVLYKPSEHTSSTLQTLAGALQQANQPLPIFIYDNSPVPTPLKGISKSFSVEYRHNPANPGLAVAYNAAAQFARAQGKKWLLLLDQDTSFPLSALDAYEKAMAEHPGICLFAPRLISQGLLCSPCGYRGGMGYHLRDAAAGVMRLKGRSLLNSGMLVSLDAFAAIGGFDERIPLDFADHDFCRRFARQFGEAYIIDLDCEHGFSDRQKSPLSTALARYAFFCRGARYSIRSFSDRITHPMVVILRCVVLSSRYRTLRFIPVLLREFGCVAD